MVLINSPFGKKSSVTIINEKGEESPESLTMLRDDFWATTSSNKQLNFVQHIAASVEMNGRAAIVVRITCSSKAEQARPSAVNCCTVATFTPSCACPPVFSTRRAPKPT
jgi:type I restriction-modification system DNA methylase subunit